MTQNVVSLNGAEIIAPGTPSPKVIVLCEDLLERARSGEIMGVSVVYAYSDGAFGQGHEGQISYGLVGALEALKVRLAGDV